MVDMNRNTKLTERKKPFMSWPTNPRQEICVHCQFTFGLIMRVPCGHIWSHYDDEGRDAGGLTLFEVGAYKLLLA